MSTLAISRWTISTALAAVLEQLVGHCGRGRGQAKFGGALFSFHAKQIELLLA